MDREFPNNYFDADWEYGYDNEESEDSNEDEFEDIFND